MSNTINTRICARRDTTENWNAHGSIVPLLGEIIVYLDYKKTIKNDEQIDVPGIKIGDGKAYVVDLPFIDDSAITNSIMRDLEAHEKNTEIHTSAFEKEKWNNKLSCEISGENLTLTTY